MPFLFKNKAIFISFRSFGGRNFVTRHCFPPAQSKIFPSRMPISSVEIRDATGPRLVAPSICRCSSPAAASTRHPCAGAAAARWWRSAARSSSSRRLQVTLWCRGAAFKLADSAILGLGALGRASRMVPAMRSWV